LDEKERNEALKLLVGVTIVFFVFFMIVEPEWRANPLGVLIGCFILALIITGLIVYGRRPEEGEEFDEEEVREAQGPIESRSGPTTIIKEREIIREIVKVRCRHCGSLYEEKLNSCPQCGAPS